jgi:GcrA cell cycle regulator
MAKLANENSHDSGFGGRREVAPRIAGTRKRRERWPQLVASVPVEFMELRPRMCRWPIGDPQQFETFRFCGCSCSFDSAYCKVHHAEVGRDRVLIIPWTPPSPIDSARSSRARMINPAQYGG